MTGSHPTATRRRVLGGLVGAAAAVCCGDHVVSGAAAPRRPASPRRRQAGLVEIAPRLTIHPRETWGADLPPAGPIAPEEVRFLLVHHTATSNVVADPVAVMRGVYAFHTGPEKRWADVAYHFFVAPDGSVWEGRAGSLAGPVAADATGGNQGFAQLVCLIGNHVATPPTPAAQDALVRVLAWLTVRYGLGVHRDASTTFVSRGSNRFPAGTTITTPIVSPHRAVTFTACPGDAAIALLPTWRRRVYELVAATWETDGLQRADRVALEAP